jgi:hypothetical protein
MSKRPPDPRLIVLLLSAALVAPVGCRKPGFERYTINDRIEAAGTAEEVRAAAAKAWTMTLNRALTERLLAGGMEEDLAAMAAPRVAAHVVVSGKDTRLEFAMVYHTPIRGSRLTGDYYPDDDVTLRVQIAARAMMNELFGRRTTPTGRNTAWVDFERPVPHDEMKRFVAELQGDVRKLVERGRADGRHPDDADPLAVEEDASGRSIRVHYVVYWNSLGRETAALVVDRAKSRGWKAEVRKHLCGWE